ncbi:S41 family peptidase [Sphingomonas sp. SM33]|uniref:S41 family peptidase n=1 Tax=Sphingomonas telluris TaxID=2907998 RepID=A0ABS9VP61_9SPHN|nr:S41 family peptidase [Sphingomonas telluris]MCH8616488.1 S41 family peptidase [Sphingomonas telluris]
MLLKSLFLAGAACCAAAPLLAQAPAAPSTLSADQLRAAVLEPGEGRKVADTLADELTGKFVIPEQGRQYAEMLRANAAAGRYDKGTRGDLAKLITDDLMATHKDGHLHLSVTEPEPAGGNSGPPSDFPKLIQSAKWLAPGVAYIRPSAFFSTDDEIAAFKAFMRDHSTAKAMIFDLRNHHGGRLGEMDVIFPYLFAEKTPLVRMEMSRAIYDKFGSPFGEAPTLEFAKDDARITATHYAVPGQATPLRDAKIYVLTSNATASAGEHFALAFKSTGRATLIGEATAGANHFGGPGPVGDHFTVWMPVGRTYDIKTGQDWEGAGVAPDLAVDPKQALVVALEKAGLSHADAVRIDATEVPLEPVHKDKVRAR